MQLFDTWAGSLPEREFRRWCIEPAKAVIALVRLEFPDVPVIGFPKGAGILYGEYARETGISGISIDSGLPLQFARDELQPDITVQGNLDPLLVVAGGKQMLAEAGRILSVMGSRRFIFNLGHGIVPETPPQNVAELVQFVKQWQA